MNDHTILQSFILNLLLARLLRVFFLIINALCVHMQTTFGIYLLSDTHTHQYVHMCKKKRLTKETTLFIQIIAEVQRRQMNYNVYNRQEYR